MHVHIDTTDDRERERVIRLLQFSLDGYRGDIASLHLTVAPVEDALGNRLSRCQLLTKPRRGREFEIDEVQADLDLAVNRAVARSLRRIRRRLENALPMPRS